MRVVLLSVLVLVGCGEHEPEQPREPAAAGSIASKAATPAASAAVSEARPDRNERGWKPVDRSLPRLSHLGGHWRIGPARVADLPGAVGKRVVLEGRMVLDDSAPMRHAFWVAPHFDGCVDKHERYHRPHWVRVTLPEDAPVQVTDKPLLVEGTLTAIGRADAPNQLELRAERVEPYGMVTPGERYR